MNATRDQNYYNLVELQGQMRECSALETDLQKELLQKAQLEKKHIERADEVSKEDPHVIVTLGVQGALENCLNVIRAIEQDRNQIQN